MFISKLKSINYDIEEFHIHLVPFQNRDIIPTTLDVEYFTVNLLGEKDLVFSTRVTYTNISVYDAIRLQILFAGHLFNKIKPKKVFVHIYDTITYLRLTNYLEPRTFSEVNAIKQFRFKVRQRLAKGSRVFFILENDPGSCQNLEKELIAKLETKDIIPTDEMLGKNSYEFIQTQLDLRRELGLNAHY